MGEPRTFLLLKVAMVIHQHQSASIDIHVVASDHGYDVRVSQHEFRRAQKMRETPD